MTADLLKQELGARVHTINAKKTALALKALALFGLTVAFFRYLYDFQAFSGDMGWIRAALPLMLPAFMMICGLQQIFCISKRVELYEHGICYHTLWFELTGAYAEIKSVEITQECGREHKQGHGEYSAATSLLPVTGVKILFQDGKRWVFLGNTYKKLAAGGEQIKADWVKSQHHSS